MFFWGHRPRRAGVVDKSCLSQWFPASFRTDGHDFASAEHYMMWRKARLFGDVAAEDAILSARSAAHAKALGRSVSGFDDAIWKLHRWEVVVSASVAKFRSNEALGRYLKGTSDRALAEASPVDRIWGIGLAADSPDVEDVDNWPGLNLLGFALMEARATL